MGNYTIFQMFENPRGGREVRNFTTNVQQMFRKFQISNRLQNRYFPKIDVGCPCRLSHTISNVKGFSQGGKNGSPTTLVLTRNGRCHFYDTQKIFDLLLKWFLLKGKKIATQARTWTSNPDLSYSNLSPLPLHYLTDPQKNVIHWQTVFLNCYINQVTLALSIIFNVNLTVGLQYRSFQDYSKTYYLPYCSLIQGICYIHHD